MTAPIYPPDWHQSWPWQGLTVSYVQAPRQPPAPAEAEPSSVVLVHGFGACKEHWRHNLRPLQAAHTAYALDLIGFGDSSKPRSRLQDEPVGDGSSWRYGIESWGAQVHDFVTSCTQGAVQLVGNSIGGVVALEAARRLEASGRPARQVVLIDCAQRALDDRRLAEQPPLRRLARPLLKAAVRQRWLTAALYTSLVKPGVIRRVLGQAYPSGANIDDQLVELLLAPARQPGAPEAFRGFINLFNDLLAPDLLAALSTPVAILWGERDPWEPVAVAESWQRHGCVRSFEALPGLGHCPHDEAPELVNGKLAALLSHRGETSC
ncbi:alpha/beta fold hydrolase [Vulcanococcus limneticus]|uniref:alpha/beta fold hydrolase n=1 Tax=Vulcanococcus limneticus TaxID=2170428 RepID=UPI00398BF81C